MKILAHEILQKLGFDVTEDGIEINPTDSFYVDTMLGLLGATISADRVPEQDIAFQLRSCSFLMHRENTDNYDIQKARVCLEADLNGILKYVPRRFS